MRKVFVTACFVMFLCAGFVFYSCASNPQPVLEDPVAVVESDPPVNEPEQKELPVPEPEFTTAAFAHDLYDVLQTGGVEDALLLFNEVPAEYKEDFSVNYLHASLLFSSGNYEAAQNLTKKLEYSQPDNIYVLLLNTMIAKAQGDTAAKNELLKKIIEKNLFFYNSFFYS